MNSTVCFFPATSAQEKQHIKIIIILYGTKKTPAQKISAKTEGTELKPELRKVSGDHRKMNQGLS